MEKKGYEILLIGKTGHGKSSLGNFLFGKKDLFKVYHNDTSGTQLTSEITINGLTIIDTPGLFDSQNQGGEKNMDKKHYEEMISFIQKRKNLKGILFVVNCTEVRLSSDLQDLIKMICNVFSYKTFKNIAFVFTKFYGKPKVKKTIEEGKKSFVLDAKIIIENFYRGKGDKLEDPENALQCFFIDSDLDDPEDDSIETRQKIFNWTQELTDLNPTEYEVKNPNYLKEYGDESTKIDVWEDDDYIYRRTKFYKTKMAIDLNHKIIPLGSPEYEGETTTKIPKKKSLWKKILGGISIGAGVLAAPFTFGTTLLATGAGSALLVDASIDDAHNEQNRKK